MPALYLGKAGSSDDRETLASRARYAGIRARERPLRPRQLTAGFNAELSRPFRRAGDAAASGPEAATSPVWPLQA